MSATSTTSVMTEQQQQSSATDYDATMNVNTTDDSINVDAPSSTLHTVLPPTLDPLYPTHRAMTNQNIELHTTYAVKETLGALKAQLALLEDGGDDGRLASMERRRKAQEAADEAAQEHKTTTKTAEEILEEEGERMHERKMESYRQSMISEAANSPVSKDDVVMAMARDGAGASGPVVSAANCPTSSGSAPDAYSLRILPQTAAAELRQSSAANSRPPSALATVNATYAERLYAEKIRQARIDAASHIRVDEAYIAYRLETQREQANQRAEDNRKLQRRILLTVLGELETEESASRRALEALWNDEGFAVDEGSIGAYADFTYTTLRDKTITAQQQAFATSTYQMLQSKLGKCLQHRTTTRGSIHKSSNCSVVSPNATLNTNKNTNNSTSMAVSSSRPASSNVARHIPSAPSPRSSLNSNYSNAGGRARITAQRSAFSISIGPIPTPAAPPSSTVPTIAIAQTTRDPYATYGLSLAEAFLLGRVEAEEKRHQRISATANAKRAVEWSASEGKFMAELNSVIATEANSIRRQKTYDALHPKPDGSTLPPVTTGNPFAPFHFSRISAEEAAVHGGTYYPRTGGAGAYYSAREGVGTMTAAQQQSRVYTTPSGTHDGTTTTTVIPLPPVTSGMNRNGIVGSGRRSNANTFTAEAAAQAEFQRAARAELSRDKWRAKVFDDEVTRAMYYASALEFRSTDKMAKYL